ncbi:MAG: GDSL-type esterase/lipase family protein [Phycisphaeraceae bacterium]
MSNRLATTVLCLLVLSWNAMPPLARGQNGAVQGQDNLALHKPVRVSGESQGQMVPEKAVDGIAGNESSWHTPGGPAWLQVDLQKVQAVDHVEVNFHHDGNRYYQYDIEVSADGNAWTRVVDMSANTAPATKQGDDHRFPPASARYVKVNLLKNSANPGLHLNELRVFAVAPTRQPLVLDRTIYLNMPDKPGTMAFADSSGQEWDLHQNLVIRNYKPGKDKVVFGSNAQALKAEQLARVGFADPVGQEPGLMFTARMLTSGQVEPGPRIKPAPLPFDASDEARAGRAKLYEVDGLAKLTGKNTPLKDGMTIAFFGDSITWLNGYIAAIDSAIKSGPGTSNMKIKLVNRGINGGGVLQIRDGSDKAGYPGDTRQAPFAQLLESDKADVAVVFIGINDVWWRNTSPENFDKAMRDLVASAKAHHATLVLATLTVHGERPDGSNGNDPKIEQYCQIIRKVAQETRTTLVDLRKAYIAYEQNHNIRYHLDGSLNAATSGILTYDGVHPNEKGVQLLGSLLGDGIYQAMTAEK